MISHSLKSIVNKILEDSLRTSTFISSLVNNFSKMAEETKKIADLLLKINERLNQHEDVILTLVKLHDERVKKERNIDYVEIESKQKPNKPN